MVSYVFEVKFAKKKIAAKIEDYRELFYEAIESINNGIAFNRDGKKFVIEQLEDDRLILKLISRNELINPSRSISALTRYFTTYYAGVFESFIFNKTLFNITLLEQETFMSNRSEELSNEELLKAMVDLLYGSPMTKNEEIKKYEVIQQIRKMIIPFLKN